MNDLVRHKSRCINCGTDFDYLMRTSSFQRFKCDPCKKESRERSGERWENAQKEARRLARGLNAAMNNKPNHEKVSAFLEKLGPSRRVA